MDTEGDVRRREGDVGGEQGDVPTWYRTRCHWGQGDVQGDVHFRRCQHPGHNVPVSTQGAAMLRPSEDTLQSPDASTFSTVGRSAASPFRRAVSSSSGREQASPEVQIVLVTGGGLELPLVESPRQAARLLEVVAEMAADTGGDRPSRSRDIAARRPGPVRVGQMLDRVRVIVRRGTSPEGGDAA